MPPPWRADRPVEQEPLSHAAMRDLLFATLEEHLGPVLFEARSDWPAGDVGWSEAVRLGVR